MAESRGDIQIGVPVLIESLQIRIYANNGASKYPQLAAVSMACERQLGAMRSRKWKE